MANETKQQQIERLARDAARALKGQIEAEDRAEKAENSMASFFTSFEKVLDERDKVSKRRDAMSFGFSGGNDYLTPEGALRRVACLAERERLYHKEFVEFKEKYHELVRGLANMPPKETETIHGLEA
jgi:hypothetical protein